MISVEDFLFNIALFSIKELLLDFKMPIPNF